MRSLESFNGIITNQVIESFKLEKNKKIRTIIISDLHDYTNNTIRSNRLAEAIKVQNPDMIFIAGDIYNTGSAWENKKKLEELKVFLQNISEASPVCITWGNHDLIGINEINKYHRIKNFYDLERVRIASIFPLYNDKVNIDNIEIIGFVPSLNLMSKEGLKTQIHGIAHDKFINEYGEKGMKFKNSPEFLNIYLGHDPHLIASSENEIGLGSLKFCDYFITGHMHDGYKALFKSYSDRRKELTGKDIEVFEYDRGLVEQPTGIVDKNNKYIKGSKKILGRTNLCRGIVYFDNSSQQKFWQSSEGVFYKNISNEANVQNWQFIMETVARQEILENNLHYMIISEGISPFMFPIEKHATINVVDIIGTTTMKRTR